jgi:hypothetical protein
MPMNRRLGESKETQVTMRTVVCFLALAALATSSFAQKTLDVDFTNASGELIGAPSGLQFFVGKLVSVGKDGQELFLAGTVGTVTFTTPAFKSGDIVNGGAFGRGGSFYISTAYDVDVTASFVSGTWRIVTLPNGTHNYFLKARIKGTMFLDGTTYSIQGTTIQLSTNTGKDLFGGSLFTSGGNTNVIVGP